MIYRVDTSGSVAGTIVLQEGGNGGIAWDGADFWVPGGKILKYDTLGVVARMDLSVLRRDLGHGLGRHASLDHAAYK